MTNKQKIIGFVLQEGEGYKIEFRESISHIAREMVAFANASGGRIFVGIHWPSDILVGAVVGIISGIIIIKLFFKKHGKRKNRTI